MILGNWLALFCLFELYYVDLCFGHNLPTTHVKVKKQPLRHVIIDVDTGLDDYLALLILIYAEHLQLLKIEAIICSAGNTDAENSLKNIIRLLEILRRIDIPVYMGAEEPLLWHQPLFPYFGENGFGNLKRLPTPNLNLVNRGLAAEAIRKIVIKNKRKISLIALGPLTTFALTSKLYPSDFFPNVKDIWILGGNYDFVNQSGATTEFNFLSDPEAAQIVFESGVRRPIYFMPLETFTKPKITYDWRFNTLGGKSPAMQLLTVAELALNHQAKEEYWISADPLLAYCYVFPDTCITDYRVHNVRIELKPGVQRGWVLLDELNEAPNVTMIREVNQEGYQSFLLEVDSGLQ